MSTYEPRPVVDNETVHDEKISPLMRQIIAICKEHGIPVLASFLYAPGEFCTTFIPGPAGDEGADTLAAAERVVRPRPSWAAFTVTTVKP